ncbi:MAG: hypothetical protein KKC51_06615 [Verrucomicrobia bacterium]|nr:hypothetical protein [Verrucomicrobiota bacterium]
MKEGYIPTMCLVVLASMSNTSIALDSGMSFYWEESRGQRQIGIMYERFERRTEGGFAITLSQWDKLQEDRYVARFAFPLARRFNIHFDLGATDVKGATGLAPLFGAGLDILAYKGRLFDLNVFTGGAYVSNIKDEETILWGVLPADDRASFVYSDEYFLMMDYYELGGGLTLSRALDLGNRTKITPYVGIESSILRGHVNEGSMLGSFYRENFKETGVVSLMGGIAVAISSRLGFRLEGRFISQTAVDASVSVAF